MVSYRILVTGSRDWDDARAIDEAFREAASRNTENWPVTVIHGTARGADRLAGSLAKARGWNVEEHPADWDRHGKRAGFLRNEEMVLSRADVCLAFIKNGSKGATMCADLAAKAGIPVVRTSQDVRP